MRAFRDNVDMATANRFLFAVADIINNDDAEELYNLVQKARLDGNAKEVIRLTLSWLEGNDETKR